MNHPFSLDSAGLPGINVVVPALVEERMLGKAFRSSIEECAGEFFLAGNPESLLQHRSIASKFVMAIHTATNPDRELQDVAISLNADRNIGWESTDEKERYADEMLELWPIGRNATALRVQPTFRYLKSPRTNVLTVAATVYAPRTLHNTHRWLRRVVIRTMYPGIPVGRLKGDMTEKTGRVWFDWSHPGA